MEYELKTAQIILSEIIVSMWERYGSNLILSGMSGNNTFFQNTFLGANGHVDMNINLQNYWDDGLKGNYWRR